MPNELNDESQRAIRELTLPELDAVSGASVGKPLPEPFPQPSPTNPNG